MLVFKNSIHIFMLLMSFNFLIAMEISNETDVLSDLSDNEILNVSCKQFSKNREKFSLKQKSLIDIVARSKELRIARRQAEQKDARYALFAKKRNLRKFYDLKNEDLLGLLKKVTFVDRSQALFIIAIVMSECGQSGTLTVRQLIDLLSITSNIVIIFSAIMVSHDFACDVLNQEISLKQLRMLYAYLCTNL